MLYALRAIPHDLTPGEEFTPQWVVNSRGDVSINPHDAKTGEMMEMMTLQHTLKKVVRNDFGMIQKFTDIWNVQMVSEGMLNKNDFEMIEIEKVQVHKTNSGRFTIDEEKEEFAEEEIEFENIMRESAVGELIEEIKEPIGV